MVLGIKKTSQDKLAKEIDQIASHLSTEFKQPIKRIVIPPHLSSVQGLKSLEEKGYIIELRTVDPLVPTSSEKNENTVIPEIIQPQILSDIKPQTAPTTSIPLESKSAKPWITIIIGAVIVLVVAGAAFFGYQKLGKAKNKPSPSPVPTVAPSPSVSPSPSPLASVSSTELKKVKISVLNGTTRKGEAKKVTDLLSKAGFNVTKTGNAVDDYKQTEIDAKATVSKDILATLKDSLENYYTMASGKTLDASASADIVVNIGLETKKSLP
jgi:hypothetical protein